MTDKPKAMPTDVQIVRRENCFKGFYRLDRLHLRHELFAGIDPVELQRCQQVQERILANLEKH